jgi:hypothetical protein
MSSSKNFPAKGLCGRCYLSEATSPPMTPFPPPLHSVHVYTVYLLFINTGKGEGGWGVLTREKVRGATVHKTG